MKYTVWVYPIVRVKFPDVEAESQVEAIKKVEAETDFYSLLNMTGVEFAEDVDCFHVDEENDPEYRRSHWYDKHYHVI